MRYDTKQKKIIYENRDMLIISFLLKLLIVESKLNILKGFKELESKNLIKNYNAILEIRDILIVNSYSIQSFMFIKKYMEDNFLKETGISRNDYERLYTQFEKDTKINKLFEEL